MTRGVVPIRDEEALEGVLDEPLAVLYKHSPLCGTSAMAARQVEAFVAANDGVPVYMVDVVRDRTMARAVADRVGVRHESPQVLVLRDGGVTWHASHGAVTATALERAIG